MNERQCFTLWLVGLVLGTGLCAQTCTYLNASSIRDDGLRSECIRAGGTPLKNGESVTCTRSAK